MSDSYIIANRTDVGKTREVNEDSMVTFDSPNGRVIAVCDGMGGQAAGDVASRLACDIITDILTNNTFGTPTEAITRACMAANQGIVHRAAQNPDLEGMGATCVMVIIKDGLVYYGWIGDSRIYYIHNGTINQLSRDQSYVQQLVDTGQITAAEAEHHPQKNEILNALGLPSMAPPELCSAPLSPAPGSVIMLCSDGLSGMVDNQTIASIIANPELSLQRKTDKLVDRANANGGTDNITLQLVQFGTTKSTAAVRSNVKKQKPNFMLWGAIVLAVIITIIVICIVFGGDKKSDPGTSPVNVENVKSTPNSSSSSKSSSSTSSGSSSSSSKSSSKSSTKPTVDKKKKSGNKSNNSSKVEKEKNMKEKFGEKAKDEAPKSEAVPHSDGGNATDKNLKEAMKEK